MGDVLSKLPLPHDRPIPGEEIIAALRVHLEGLAPGTPEHHEATFELMRYCGLTGMIDEALAVLDTLLEADVSVAAKARATMVTATSVERTGDFNFAVALYRRVLALLPHREPDDEDPYTHFFAHNNLAYSLNQLGSFEEGEVEARAAIAIDPDRFNAHKNLGVALEGQGRFVEAANEYIAAVHADPLEPRSLKHLEALIAARPEVLAVDATLTAAIARARDARKRLFQRPGAQES
jgi:tetratricopeptide (TPR) repeat protein